MKDVLFLIERPTPQRAPVLDSLHAHGIPMKVIYLHGDAAEQGWGDLPLQHPHLFADRMTPVEIREEVDLARRGRYSVIVCMGYRGRLRSSVLKVAHEEKIPVAMRFDTNQIQIESSHSVRRTARRWAMRSRIPRTATAWAIGGQNERFWRQEIGLTSIVRIPYEVPVLPGGIPATEVTRIRASDPERLRFLYVGRLTEIKRVEDAIDAFMATTHPGWSLRIVGTGPREGLLRQRAGSDPRVTFAGSRTYVDLGADFMAADVLVLPSSGEPWGLVVNEALGYGLRVLASDQVGAAYDMLTPESGEMFPVGDVAGLTGAMNRCIAHLTQNPRPPATDTASLMAADLHRLAEGRP